MKTAAQKRARKEESMDTLRECFSKSSIAIFTDYRGEAAGLTVKQITDLRGKLREGKADYRVAKNTLIVRTLNELGIEGLEDKLAGPTAIAFGYDDPAATAKTILDFAKDQKPNNLPRVKAAWLEGQVLSHDRLQAIAELPSIDQLRMQLLGLMLAPHRQLLGMLNAPGRSLATLFEAYSKKDQEG